MKKVLNFNILLIISIMSVLYIVPVSTIKSSQNYNIYFYTRLIFIIYAFLLFLKKPQINSTYIILIVVCILRLLFYKEISANIILLASCIYVFNYLLESDIEFSKINKIISIASDIFFIQIIIATIIAGKLEVNSFILDRNYTSYFIFLLFSYFLCTKNKRWILWMILALCTYSRAAIIAVTLTTISYLFFNRKEYLNKEKLQKIFIIAFVIANIMIIPISYMFVRKFNSTKYEYTYLQGFNRMSNFLDNSNYLRFSVNIFAIDSLNPKNIVMGLESDEFKGLNYISGKRLFPHNTLLGLYINFGMIISVIYLYQYIKIFKKYTLCKTLPIYIGLIIYQLFLGTSSFYGVELLAFLVIIQGIDQFIKKEEDVKI